MAGSDTRYFTCIKHFCFIFQELDMGSGSEVGDTAEVHIQLVVCYYNTTPASEYNWYELSHDRINIAATDKGVFCRLRWWLSIKVLADSSLREKMAGIRRCWCLLFLYFVKCTTGRLWDLRRSPNKLTEIYCYCRWRWRLWNSAFGRGFFIFINTRVFCIKFLIYD